MDVSIERVDQSNFQLGAFKIAAMSGSEDFSLDLMESKNLKASHKDQLFKLVKIYLESHGQKGIRESDEFFNSKAANALDALIDLGLVCVNPNSKPITEFFPTINAFLLLKTDLFTFDQSKFPAFIISKDLSSVILPSEELVKSFFEFVKNRHLEEPLKIQKWAEYLEMKTSCLLDLLKVSPHFKFLIANNLVSVGSDTLTVKSKVIPNSLNESFTASLLADNPYLREEVLPIAKRQVRDLSSQIHATKGKIVKLIGESDNLFTVDKLGRDAISQGLMLPANTILQVALQGLVSEGKLLSFKNGVYQLTANQKPEISLPNGKVLDIQKLSLIVKEVIRAVNNQNGSYKRMKQEIPLKLATCTSNLGFDHKVILEALKYFKNQEFIDLIKGRKLILTNEEATYLKIDLNKL